MLEASQELDKLILEYMKNPTPELKAEIIIKKEQLYRLLK
jgi:hypothetical protein